jgi:hypothetical protein
MGKLIVLALVGIGVIAVVVVGFAVKTGHLISEAIGSAIDAW